MSQSEAEFSVRAGVGNRELEIGPHRSDGNARAARPAGSRHVPEVPTNDGVTCTSGLPAVGAFFFRDSGKMELDSES